MASGDYRSCDVCRKKTFYDANLYYENADDGGFLDNGEPSYSTLGDLGAWAVLCTNCAKTHAAIVMPIGQADEAAELRAALREWAEATRAAEWFELDQSNAYGDDHLDAEDRVEAARRVLLALAATEGSE